MIFSAARPRMIVMLDGLSCAVIEMATPGITVEVAGLAEPGPVKKAPRARTASGSWVTVLSSG